MARPQKSGLDYFPLDTTFYDDIKVRKLIRYHGGQAVSVYVFLLCSIYRDGYFIKWDNDLPFVVAERTGSTEAYVNDVLNFCLETGLFSQQQMTRNQIITGKGIQDRYSLVCKNSKRILNIKPEYTCINSEETVVITEETPVNTEETVINSESGTQRKGKEIKGKKSKEIKGRIFDPLHVDMPFESDVFKEAWKTWVGYKKDIKSPITEASAKLQIQKIAEQPEKVAIRMIYKAIESGWKSFFELSDHELSGLSSKANAGSTKPDLYPNGHAKPKLVY